MDDHHVNNKETSWRLSSQPVLPIRLNRNDDEKETYQVFPHHHLESGELFNGYESLCSWILAHQIVLIDGYAGIIWKVVKSKLADEFHKKGVQVNWVETADYLKHREEIAQLVKPWLGEPISVWGTKTNLVLPDFFRSAFLKESHKEWSASAINIIIGAGAALFHEQAPVIYLDLPKNELQYRMRAGSVYNLGNDQSEDATQMYKRFYFVDWVVLNAHKQGLLKRMTLVADGQQQDDINWMTAQNLRNGLQQLSSSVFRVRPWFEAGAWGGQWMKDHIPLNKKEINYAWSFELITPENGLVFESDGYLLEVSFDFLMFQASSAVLGKHAQHHGMEFPIRFDFLDTYQGGNLSIQCHPSVNYIRKVFGERITQDETYYILDCEKDAQVYLGFQEGVDPAIFRTVLTESQLENKEVNIDVYVQKHPAHRHDLFLIPNGTIHSAGENNLVLEISATPYIFTFKMYDWLRLDLSGIPRPINIDHAFKNLNFERAGEMVKEKLISKPETLSRGEGWELIHLPTHHEHFYDIHRIEFDKEITILTENVCHVMMLVQGGSLSVKTADGTEVIFNYCETFVIPAAAEYYTLTNKGPGKAFVIKAFLKDLTPE
ncbi:MAG: class I mannose-6-phosphate isomerase [Sphingobacteriaceae bacterium]